jgi:KDO2-lipid IV(A) lauroyltransferase
MKAAVYYLTLPFLYLISALPFRVLYAFSWFVYIILYYVAGYRKTIIRNNLRNSFPKKSDAEINALMKKFYRYFCDLFIETFKTLTISQKKMIARCQLSPQSFQLFEKYANENKSLIIVMGHFGNWEWAGNTFSLLCKHQLYVIYHPLRNTYFNNLIIKMRTRFGTKLIPMRDTFKEMIKNRNELNVTAFIADQTPAPENAYWTTFLNQDTPVFRGTGKIAQKISYPIIYVSVKLTSRGKYMIHAETLCENPAALTEDEISEIHTRRLERDIIEQPEIWLWSHRRWKHKRPIA